jgi:hypothetical protein
VRKEEEAPQFLEDEQKFKEMIGKSFELQNPEDLKYTAAQERNQTKEKKKESTVPTAELVA